MKDAIQHYSTLNSKFNSVESACSFLYWKMPFTWVFCLIVSVIQSCVYSHLPPFWSYSWQNFVGPYVSCTDWEARKAGSRKWLRPSRGPWSHYWTCPRTSSRCRKPGWRRTYRRTRSKGRMTVGQFLWSACRSILYHIQSWRKERWRLEALTGHSCLRCFSFLSLCVKGRNRFRNAFLHGCRKIVRGSSTSRSQLGQHQIQR